MNKKDYIIDNFTADESEVREYLTRPFFMDDLVVASNGHILIFRKEKKGDKFEELKTVSGSTVKQIRNGYINKALAITDWHEFPVDFEAPEYQEATSRKCPDCNGFRELNFYSGSHEYTVTCKECNGEGETLQREIIRCKVNGQQFDYHYIRKITALENLKIYQDKDKPELLFFKSGEYMGAIMGLKN